MKNIQTAEDILVKKNIVNRLSYVPGGISVDTSTLVVGSIVAEAMAFTAPASGLRKLCKQAVILAGSTGTAVKLVEKTHHFKVGNVVGLATGSPAYAITAITNAAGVDTLTIGTTIGSPTTGAFLYEMATAGATGALKNTADCVIHTAFTVTTNNVFVSNEGLLHAVVLENAIAPEYLAVLKGICVAKY